MPVQTQIAQLWTIFGRIFRYNAWLGVRAKIRFLRGRTPVISFNIVTTIIGLLAPAILEKLAAALGTTPAAAKEALGAAVPAVLAAMGSKASTEAGAKALFDSISKADTGMLGNLAGALTGGSGEKLLQGGLGSLGSLLGEGGVRTITSAIGSQASLGGSAASAVVSLAGTLAMGQLAKSVAGDGLDAAGLGKLLASQQANISQALPAGLAQQLAGAGTIARDFAAQAGRTAEVAAQTPAQAAKASTNWLMWVVPAVIVLAALWWFLGHRSAEVTEAVPAAVKEVVVDGVDVGKQVTGALDGLKTTLGGITDAATAQAALPKLQEAVTSVDSVTGILAKLSPDQKTMIAGLVSAALPALKDLAAKVVAIPGVGDVVKPTIDGLLAKVDALAKPA